METWKWVLIVAVGAVVVAAHAYIFWQARKHGLHKNDGSITG
jgi:hypothetical protein